MENDKGAFFLAEFGDGSSFPYDNAEAARIALRNDAKTNPELRRHLWKVLPYKEPIEIMI